MATTAYGTLGTTLTWNGNAVAYRLEIGGVNMTAREAEITNHDSPDRAAEYITTILEGGTVSLRGLFKASDANGQIALKNDCETGTAREAVITYPDGTTWTFDALVTQFGTGDATPEGVLEFNAALRITGKPVLGVTASGGLTALAGVDSAVGALDFIPNFANAEYLYSVAVATGITYVKLTPTAASHTITITNAYDGSSQTVASGAQSGELALDDANTVTKITIRAQESGKAAVEYTIYVTRAAS